MTTRSWLNLSLLLVMLLLAALVYLEPGKQSEARVRLSQIKGATVQQIKIEREDGKTLLLQRQGQQWQMLEPVAVAADQFYVEQVFDILVRVSLQRYPVAGLDMSKYGLQPPRARLWLDGVELDFGRTNPLNSHLYVMTDGVLHMVAQNDISVLTANWTEYVARAPFAAAELVALQLPGLGKIKHDAQGWHYEGDQAPASADQLQMLADAWRQAQALQVRPVSKLVAAETAVVQLAGGEVVRLGVLRSADELVLQRLDLGLEYVFDVSQSKRLLQWAGQAAEKKDE